MIKQLFYVLIGSITFSTQCMHTSLIEAAKNGETSVVLTTANPSNINEKDHKRMTALHWAARKGHHIIARALIRQQGIELDCISADGSTPLHEAAEKGFSEIVDWLITAGAPVNAQDRHGFSPLHLAALKGHYKTVATLLKHKAQTELRLITGDTPLFCAAISGQSGVIEMLLIAGANKNAVDGDGNKPSSYARSRKAAALLSTQIKSSL